MNYTFSSDGDLPTLYEWTETSRMGAEFFGSDNDPEQTSASKESRDFMREYWPRCINVIKKGDELVGYTYLFPTSFETMQTFLDKVITEAELYKKAENEALTIENAPCIYLCSTFITKKHRRKGLASTGFVKTLEKLRKTPAILFAWEYTAEGKGLAKNVALAPGYKLLWRSI